MTRSRTVTVETERGAGGFCEQHREGLGRVGAGKADAEESVPGSAWRTWQVWLAAAEKAGGHCAWAGRPTNPPWTHQV